jgi:predicted DNA-binding antitoxin AbrB/MazE fold protein
MRIARNQVRLRGRMDMERMDIEAVYEDGTLKLPHPLPLRSGQKVTITIHPPQTAGGRLWGLIQWKGTQEDLDYLILSEDNDSLEAP